MFILTPADIDRVNGNHPHLVTEGPQMGRLPGQLWGAAEVVGGEAALAERAGTPFFVEAE